METPETPLNASHAPNFLEFNSQLLAYNSTSGLEINRIDSNQNCWSFSCINCIFLAMDAYLALKLVSNFLLILSYFIKVVIYFEETVND
jgi:hypothetical protein